MSTLTVVSRGAGTALPPTSSITSAARPSLAPSTAMPRHGAGIDRYGGGSINWSETVPSAQDVGEGPGGEGAA